MIVGNLTDLGTEQKTCLFLAACWDSVSLAELLPSHSLQLGSCFFCESPSPAKKRGKKILLTLTKCMQRFVKDVARTFSIIAQHKTIHLLDNDILITTCLLVCGSVNVPNTVG